MLLWLLLIPTLYHTVHGDLILFFRGVNLPKKGMRVRRPSVADIRNRRKQMKTLEKSAAKKYRAFEITMAKRNKVYWDLIKMKKKGRK